MDFDKIIIDGEKLVADDDFKSAMSAVIEDGENTFVTGSAGTGKTFFLKTLCKISEKKKIVLAPTGVTAINAGGSTIHSQFRLPLHPLLMSDNIFRIRVVQGDSDKRTIFNSFKYDQGTIDLFRELELLIIDEVSMVRCDVITALDWILKVFRNNYIHPFGGVQVVLIGDPFQLAPIVKTKRRGEEGQGEDDILKQGGYGGRFFFSTFVFRDSRFRSFELKKVRRQRDKKFINLLNNIRNAAVNHNDVQLLNGRVGLPEDDKGFIYITTTNARADNRNTAKLNAIDFELHSFQGIIDGVFKSNDLPAPNKLKLKKGAQIMILKNLTDSRLKNGTIGVIHEIYSDKIAIKLDGVSDVFLIKRIEWENIEYRLNPETRSVEEKVIGTFTQFPLRLAWAITVHKSQGMTFDKVIADLRDTFTYGQVYVGLSRCTSLEHLYLESQLNQFQINPHPRVVEFYRGLEL
ncbi:AAA family ATPase [Crocinitomicaceae bacterium]|nr:AAA family ATPase [Crocinitomicaceae bacterium]